MSNRPTDGKAKTIATTKTRYIAPVKEAELACRIMEAVSGNMPPRPDGWTAEMCLHAMEDIDRDAWRRAACAAMEYWRECINNINSTN